MGVLTSKIISTYYDRFKDIGVTFTKEIIQVTGLLTQQVHLKCGNDFWPCVVYSASFETAKVVANVKTGLISKLQSANNFVNLRFCFKPQGESNPITFFVAGRILASAPYGNTEDVNIFTIQFTNRPPDDFIEIMGRVLDANVNSAKRKEERVQLTVDTMRKLNLTSAESTVFIQNVPRRCILRDLSFSGSKLIMMGVAKFLLEKETALRVDFNDPRESFLVKGVFVRAEEVQGKKEMVALGMNFHEATIPMGFKLRLNDFLTATRADFRNAGEDGVAEAEPPKAPNPALARAAAVAAAAEAEPPKAQNPALARAAAVAAAAAEAEQPKAQNPALARAAAVAAAAAAQAKPAAPNPALARTQNAAPAAAPAKPAAAAPAPQAAPKAPSA